MFQFFKNLFLRKKSEDETVVETKYFQKYKNLVDWNNIAHLIEEYKSGDIIFEPIRNKLTEQTQKNLYEQIDKSEILSSQEKFEAIIGLMMVLDGSFPEPPIVPLLEKVFGKEFMEEIEKKREGFKTDIAVKKLIRFVKWKYNRWKKISPSNKTDFDPLTKEARDYLKEEVKKIEEEKAKLKNK